MPLQVHRREGEPCPRCGATIAAIHYSERITCYCPEEQTGGRVLADRRLSQAAQVATAGGLEQHREVERGAEWVRAPTEMKSTPVAEIAATVSRSTPPEASRVTRRIGAGRVAGGDRRCAGRRGPCCRAAGGMRRRRERRRPRRGRGTRPRPASPGWAAAGPGHGLSKPAGEGDVVLLDQDRVVEAHAVVHPAAGADRGLLERAQQRRRLAGVEDHGAPALRPRRLDEAGGQGRDAGEVAEQVERDALAGEQAARRAARPSATSRGHVVASTGPSTTTPVELAAAGQPERLGGGVEPEDDARAASGRSAPAPAPRRARSRRSSCRRRPGPRRGRGRPARSPRRPTLTRGACRRRRPAAGTRGRSRRGRRRGPAARRRPRDRCGGP